MWEEGGHFGGAAGDVERGGDPYVIVIPPPNVTSKLHAGHGLNSTIQDVLVRWRRMQGRVALWIPGTDHAGIATQSVVEKQLAAEGGTRQDLGREAFVERVWEHVRETGDIILDQLKRIGCSCDWERTRFTLDEGLSRAVREIFVRLYEDDLVYRGEYIINWCPRCLTALSDEEAEGAEVRGSLWHIRYPIAAGFEDGAAAARAAGASAVGRLPDGRWHLTVSTTRPETMLGDTGVAVNPADPRYGPIVGASIELPLAGRTIPLVADQHVDADFGTGMVKVTPAHDSNDFEIASRTGLELLNVMTARAEMNENAPEAFRGLPREDARAAVVAALDRDGLLAGRDDHDHAVPCCYRCDTVLEPRLSEQWFVRTAPLARRALQASRDGTVTFVPAHWTRVYEQWMENIRDWCISRQLWWGHRIPVWDCATCGAVMARREDPDRCDECGETELEQDQDVLDTWFSSWLWPFSVFGWPERTRDLEVFYPGHTLVTAPEILFFWVARMIMSGYHAMGAEPFRRVYLHGTVRDIQGRKMSKSLGNGIDPLEVVDLYGADALRFTLIASAGVGADIRLDHEDLEAAFSPGRNFVNKLWNAGRFALMSLGDEPVPALAAVEDGLALEDRWILSRRQRAIRRTGRELGAFRIHGAAEVLRDFFRGEFADWYLECVKHRLRADGPRRAAARAVLLHVLDTVCRLLHPMIPFVTEELWRLLPVAGEGGAGAARAPSPDEADGRGAGDGARAGDGPRTPLIASSWPEEAPALVDERAEAEFDWLRELIVRVRGMRKEYRVSEGREVHLHVTGGGAERARGHGAMLKRLARIGTVESAPPAPGLVGASAVLRDGTELFLPLAGVIDLEREVERLGRELGRLEARLRGLRAKLANENFVTRAPEAVVAREREKLASCEVQFAKLRAKVASLRGQGD